MDAIPYNWIEILQNSLPFPPKYYSLRKTEYKFIREIIYLNRQPHAQIIFTNSRILSPS